MTSAPQSEADQADAVAFLSDPVTHGGHAPEIVTTHAAKLFLAGEDAWKMKRAVSYPFLDFTTPAERRRVCEREVALNRITAPHLYLGCVPVTREAGGGLAIGGQGAPVEWLVHMRRFDAAATLDRALEQSGLDGELADDLAERIAAMHAAAAPAHPPDPAARVRATAEETLDDLAAQPDLFSAEAVQALAERTRAALTAHADLIADRAAGGHVRRCHGDLHLGNIALIDGRPVIFDALEFDEDLATTDVLYDLAFLLMDLGRRGARDAANRILNRWIAARREPADIAGLALLPLFLSMRAGVRAKVAAARGDAAEARAYLDAALAAASPPPPVLLAVGGFSGSGKSVLARRLAPFLGSPPGALVLRSDQIRKELAGVGEVERLPQSAYTPAASDRVYGEMRARARAALAAGWPVVADAVHGKAEERTAISQVAAEAGAPFGALWLEADPAALRARVTKRAGDASDAGADVVDWQVGALTPPQDWPRIANTGPLDETERAARAALAACLPPLAER